jgi:hypothetical protein
VRDSLPAASLEIEAGSLPAARARLEEADQIVSEIHLAADVLAFILSNLGFVAILPGDFVAAADHCLASLTKSMTSSHVDDPQRMLSEPL